ncbi:MAG: tRNA-intron lyase [Thermoplasmataceae archaeon]
MPKAVCSPLTFKINMNRSATYINSRYGVGKILHDSLFLEPYEALFLYFTGRIVPENSRFDDTKQIIETYITDRDDFDLFRAYLYLKSKGMIVRKDSDRLLIRRKSGKAPSVSVHVKNESSRITFRELVCTAPTLYLTIDDEGDITLFRTSLADPVGEVAMTWPGAEEIFEAGGRFYLNNPAERTWLGSGFGEKRILTDMEARFILKQGKNDIPGSLETAYVVYEDLVKRNLIVKTGFKYGANFRAYRKSMSDHAEFLIHVIEDSDQWYKISRAVRISHGVRKSMIFAGIGDGKVQYVMVSRTLEFFDSD